uniref:Antitoxin Xre/MbcA/ParS-like toxin-binding domain-containing protein n=1 Tax=Desulfovibrio sp. U5L TaxID=596152 RepID=I2Q7I7_9BACT
MAEDDRGQDPVSRYRASAIADFSDHTARERLSPAAARGFCNILERWGLADADACSLLGGVPADRLRAMRRDPAGVVFDQDALQRVSFLVGIFKAVNLLFGQALADAWVRLPNHNRIFGGLSPLDYMIRGGLPAFQTVRRLLDARRGGA